MKRNGIFFDDSYYRVWNMKKTSFSSSHFLGDSGGDEHMQKRTVTGPFSTWQCSGLARGMGQLKGAQQMCHEDTWGGGGRIRRAELFTLTFPTSSELELLSCIPTFSSSEGEPESSDSYKCANICNTHCVVSNLYIHYNFAN